MPPPHLEASVIVCTLDRGPKITATIESLLQQDAPDGGFEILLVDNGSRAENVSILTDFAARFPERVRYVREEEIGESAARNCGTRHARGAVHVHIDDDAIADPGWLRAICRPFAEDPNVGGAGGRIRLRFEDERPGFVDEELEPYLSSFEAGDGPRDLEYPHFPRGANMAFRATVFETAGAFSTDYGRKGPSLLSYSETEMFFRIARAGWRIVYVPGAGIDHLVSGTRLNRDWFKRRIHWQGRSMGRFDREHFGLLHVLARAPRMLLKCFTRPALHRDLPRGWLIGAFSGRG
jgi:GT2 family glycosyltransferase